MKPVEDKRCYSQMASAGNGGGHNRVSNQRAAFGKPTPSKWDDAQKWLVGLSRGGEAEAQLKARNSNADDRRLIAPVPQKEEDYSSGEDEPHVRTPDGFAARRLPTMNVDCENNLIWKINKSVQDSFSPGVQSVSVRDMGTEMTPAASQEPSRTGTPVQVRTPVIKSPITSGISTPVRFHHAKADIQPPQPVSDKGTVAAKRYGVPSSFPAAESTDLTQAAEPSPLETRASAWDEAERARYMARYKREEVKIQVWENHAIRKAETEMRKVELKAERLKARAQERLTNRLATTKRIAEERRACAEAKLNEKAASTSEKADYIRRTGHLPSSLSFKLPSFCW